MNYRHDILIRELWYIFDVIGHVQKLYKINNISTKVCSGCNCRSDAGSDIVRNFCLYK